MAAPLRIALISEHASPLAVVGGVDAGGQNVYVEQVARHLARAGHQVDVLTRRDDRRLAATVDVRPGFRVVHIDAGPPEFVRKEELLQTMPAFMRAAEQWLQHSVPYDVVHANFFMSGLVGLRLKRRFGVPLAVTFHALGLVRREHQGTADAFPPERIEIERTLVREADRVVAECPQDVADLKRLYGATDARMTTIGCGVDVRQFCPMPREEAQARLGLPPCDFTILQLGRIVPRKGIDNVIRALPLLDPALGGVRLVVVGGDGPDPQGTPEIARLQTLAQQYGVADRVTFTGRRDRAALRCCYAAADVFVTTPWYEPFGITPLEAMACGTPVIGSAVGGIAHTVRDQVTGALVPPRDPAALAIAIDRLRADPALGRRWGRAGIERVRRHFTWDVVTADLMRMYRRLRPVHARGQRPALAVVPGEAAAR